MRTMYDSVTAADVPAGAQIVGGYVNGTFAWSAADWDRFPTATKVRIATRANVNDGNVLDVEKGDATPGEAPGWVVMRRAAGVDPTVYCNASALATVQAAFTAANVPQPHYWVAHYDNIPSIPDGAVAKQYINDPSSGGHYDLSAVADYWPGVDAPNSQNGGFLMALTDDQQQQLYDWVGGLYSDASATYLATNKATTQGKAIAWMYQTLANTPDINGDGRQGDLSLVNFRQFLVDKLNEIDKLLAANPPMTPDAYKQVLDASLAQHVAITGTVNITGTNPAPPPAG